MEAMKTIKVPDGKCFKFSNCFYYLLLMLAGTNLCLFLIQKVQGQIGTLLGHLDTFS